MYNVQRLSRMLPISVMSNVKTTTLHNAQYFQKGVCGTDCMAVRGKLRDYTIFESLRMALMSIKICQVER